MGCNYYAVRKRPSTDRMIHIGKSSWGWRFCFETHNDTWHDPPIVWNTYDQVTEWLRKYTVETDDYVIMDEEDRIVPYDDFVAMVQEKQENNEPDNFRYARNVNGYRFAEGEFC